MNSPSQRFPYLFGEHHRELSQELDGVVKDHVVPVEHLTAEWDEDRAASEWAETLRVTGIAGLCVPRAYGGRSVQVDFRSICLAREAIAWGSGFCDTLFAMQGLGSYPITLAGTEDQKQRYLPGVARAETLCAFALTEDGAGSDVGALTTTATKVAGGYLINGRKCFISNAGVAGLYVVFARLEGTAGTDGMVALIVTPHDEGFFVVKRQKVMAPHPIGVIGFRDCFVPQDRLLGQSGRGFQIAMATLDRFRPGVGAAALGMGQRAVEEAMRHTQSRTQFGKALFDFQMVQAHLATAVVELEAARLLVYHAAWHADHAGDSRITLEAAMAKLQATEAAFRAIDTGVQLHGGSGVVVGSTVERLYREVRALRIYEGTSEIQRLVIARHLRTRKITDDSQTESK